MKVFKKQIQDLITFWECEKNDCISEGHDSLQYEDYEECETIIEKLSSLIEEVIYE